jgi:hypothetical protein
MRGAVLYISACLLLGAASASAAEIEARGPRECPDTGELSFRVERSVNSSLVEAPAVKFVIDMNRSAAGYVAHVALVGPGDSEAKERVLTGADCNQLADAIVVAVTLALGASRTPAVEVARQEPASSPSEAVPLPAVDEAGAALESAAPSRSLRPALSLSLLVDAGSLPAPALGAALGAELSWEHFQLRALGSILFEQHTAVSGGSGPTPGADLGLFAGGLLACTLPFGDTRSSLSLPICLGLELGRLAGVGTGVASPRSGSALWAAPRLDLGARWSIPRSALRLELTLSAATPLNRSRFELTEIGTVYHPPSVVGRLSLGVGVAFD